MPTEPTVRIAAMSLGGVPAKRLMARRDATWSRDGLWRFYLTTLLCCEYRACQPPL